MKTGPKPIPVEDRFWDKVDKSGECWEWTASKDKAGYGQVAVDRKPVGAHRVGYELQIGDIPDGMCVLHRCDNRLCVRGDHLFIGTQADNMTDMKQKGRSPRGSDHWNTRLTEDDVLAIRRLLAKGYKQSHIGKFFGIARQTLSGIATGKTWSHLTDS